MATKLRPYTQAEIRRIAARDELADGWYRFMVTRYERKEDENKPVTLQLQVNPLQNPEDASTAHRLSMYLSLPLAETDSSGEIERFRFEQSGRAGGILLDGIPATPVWHKQARKWTLNGETVTKDAAMAAREAALEAGLNGLIEAYNDESNAALGSLVSKVFYGCVVRKESKNPQYAGTVFANVTNITAELPANAKLNKPEAFVFTPAVAEGEEAPAAKKTSKKTPRRAH